MSESESLSPGAVWIVKILFLDDMSARRSAFFNKFGFNEGQQIFFAETAAHAIALLDNHIFDQVFLDHDLCIDDIMCPPGGPSKEPTGMAVVDHIVSMANPPAWVVVHTMNPPAAAAMEAKLKKIVKRVERIPFDLVIA